MMAYPMRCDQRNVFRFWPFATLRGVAVFGRFRSEADISERFAELNFGIGTLGRAQCRQHHVGFHLDQTAVAHKTIYLYKRARGKFSRIEIFRSDGMDVAN
jgi:hypothetical protein